MRRKVSMIEQWITRIKEKFMTMDFQRRKVTKTSDRGRRAHFIL